ncbi:unnamed protein product [Penicillium salamii]|uniref:Protein kinase domain-containing protein n=1 Tax=Penicillium salamii TaxID=1612424 RepID=A0A9W4I7Q4_9EURO|nr:hypothetical protein CBS147333_10132 [Penicillium roqueforti]CAG7938858.1 unnamed protein product [Penicillium salamii]KAI3187437.1 hypothetical protein CBS147311_10202 [Penicillium roqueforti]KAI3260871.1 hypothetical protein CBS147308_10105 [Penicillium roqueforti]KAI3276393.1 hypothetical protein DTO003C3_10221 [Penicillium roqueforti]
MMKHNQVNPSRPPTVWVDQSAFFHEHPSSKPISSPDIQPSPSQMMTAAAIALGSKKSLPARPKPSIPQLNQNPWDTFEPVAASSQDRSLIFARHKTMKGELVHIQQLKQQFSPATELMEQISHPSFLRLLECYHHDTSCTLVWEPTEVSVSHILASSCSITSDELVGIVKPILEGIQYLRGLGRALATLGPETILLTQAGDVKIMGVENSCQINESEMNPATMKLCALADVVTKLMLRNPTYEWEPEIKNLPCQLESISVEELLQNAMFTRGSCEGELKLLVSVANKTAYHGIKSYYARC